MTESATSALAPPLRPVRVRAAAATALVARVAAVATGMHRAILAALHAHARRQVALALGERVDVLNAAIRNGAAARRALNSGRI